MLIVTANNIAYKPENPEFSTISAASTYLKYVKYFKNSPFFVSVEAILKKHDLRATSITIYVFEKCK
jgi:hypothetical protein